MGIVCPPLYGKEDALAIIDEITKIDEKINALLIEREAKVENLKKSIK